MLRRLIILGSTGSIGTQAIEVVEHINALHDRGQSPVRFDLVGLAAGANARALGEQANRLGCTRVALADATCDAPELPTGASLLRGIDAAEELVRTTPCDLVLAAMVGSAGLQATLASIELQTPIALANKETLVAAGELVIAAACTRRVSVLPVDSEHAALWQCFLATPTAADEALSTSDRMRLTTLEDIDPPFVGIQNVRKAILTASGGAFRTWTKDKIEKATPEDALKHPTWAMGAKVTVDSASLMNKGLELIEAHWLFGLPASKLDVLVHPQSIVHAIAEFDDGSSVAQLAPPDMRLPIQRALTWPLHVDGVSRRMSWRDMTSLEFSQVDKERFPSLGLAYEVLRMGGTSGAVLNAANEEAVGAFLRGGRGEGAPMPFGRIHDLVADALACVPIRQLRSLGDVQEAETLAREHVRRRLASRSG